MAGAAYLVLCIFCALAGGVVGRIKGSSFWLWFLITGAIALFGAFVPLLGVLAPLLGVLVAVFYRREERELRRQCPGCGRIVKLYDAKCMRCGEELEFPDVAIASEATIREKLGAAGRS